MAKVISINIGTEKGIIKGAIKEVYLRILDYRKIPMEKSGIDKLAC